MSQKYSYLKIRLANPEEIEKWSSGEVINAETINYRTLNLNVVVYSQKKSLVQQKTINAHVLKEAKRTLHMKIRNVLFVV